MCRRGIRGRYRDNDDARLDAGLDAGDCDDRMERNARIGTIMLGLEILSTTMRNCC